MIRYTAEGLVFDEPEYHSGNFPERVFFYWLNQWDQEWLWQEQYKMLRDRQQEPLVTWQ